MPAPLPRTTFIDLGAVNIIVASRAAEHSPAPALAMPGRDIRIDLGGRRRSDDHKALMFFPEGQVRVFLYGHPVNMRLSFDGLYALARHGMHQDPLSGNLFPFINRRATQIRVLYFDRNGLCVWGQAPRTRPARQQLGRGDQLRNGLDGSEAAA